jgi:hypothetical protein
MPFTTAFTVTQGGDCSQFAVNDTSTYNIEASGTFSARKVTIQLSDGSYLKVGNTTYNEYVWPFASGNTLTLSGVDEKNNPYIAQDYSMLITLTLTSNAPQPGSVYTKQNTAVLTCYTMSGFYTFANKMAVNPSLEKDYKFVKDVMRLWIEQESAKNAGIDGDFQSSQASLNRAKYIIDNLTIGY